MVRVVRASDLAYTDLRLPILYHRLSELSNRPISRSHVRVAVGALLVVINVGALRVV